MAFVTNRTVPAGALTNVDTEAKYGVGEVVSDETGNQYVYGIGVASAVAGSWVALDEAAQSSLLGATSKGRVGIAMGAIIASTWGFFQVYGKSVTALALAGFADNGDIYATSTAGSIDDAIVAGDRVKGAIGRSAVSGGVITAELSFPIIDQMAD
jgi:hypothetical protein